MEPFIEKCKESVWKYKRDVGGSCLEPRGLLGGYGAPLRHLSRRLYRVRMVEPSSRSGKRACSTRASRSCPTAPAAAPPLSSHEVAQGYKDVKERSAIVTLQGEGRRTPISWPGPPPPGRCPPTWRCASIPHETYCECQLRGRRPISWPRRWSHAVLARGNECRCWKPMPGAELGGHGIRAAVSTSWAKTGKARWYVICDDYVTLTDGTGIVHIAPGLRRGRRTAWAGENELPFVQLVDTAGQV